MELIDKKALIEAMSGHVISMSVCLSKDERDGMERMYNTLMNDIEKAPTVDANPVKHGRWHYTWGGEYPYCSCCGRSDSNAGKYCGNCGAKMDAETE